MTDSSRMAIARAMAGIAVAGAAVDLAEVIDEVGDEAQSALDALAKGIYPPLLESDGLKAALSNLAASAPVAVSVDGDGVGRYRPDIEAAVYFHVLEALTNAVEHGVPSGDGAGAIVRGRIPLPSESAG